MEHHTSMTALPKPLVLIVEDEPPIAQLLTEVLHEHGYHTVVAGDANAAMQALETLRPAVMTLDLGLPGINGITLLRLIRAERPAAELQVIVITAHPHIDPYLRQEAQAIIAKPFDLDRLVATLGTVLSKQWGDEERAVGEQRVST